MAETRLKSNDSKVWVVIPAAGIGQRMLSKTPKQYLKIRNKTIIEHTLTCFLGHAEVAGIVVVLSNDDKYWQCLHIDTKSTPMLTAEGGLDRTKSVIQGLKHLLEETSATSDSWVMVHDAARPCLSKADLDSLLKIRHSNKVGGILASPVRDTMKRAKVDSVNPFIVSHTESRDNLWHALTPQMFRLGVLNEALDRCQKAEFAVTDECSAIEYMGESPVIIECIYNNPKITQASDLSLATFLLDSQNTNGEAS